MPLPRRQQQQQGFAKSGSSSVAGSSKAGGTQKVTFSVTAAAAEGRRVLQSITALLTAVGGAQQVSVDSGAWKIRCRLPSAAAATSAEQQRGEQPVAKKARTEAVEAAQQDESRSVPFDVVEVSVFQQRRGMFDVVACVQPGTDGASAVGYGSQLLGALKAVRDDLALMWLVGEVQLV